MVAVMIVSYGVVVGLISLALSEYNRPRQSPYTK